MTVYVVTVVNERTGEKRTVEVTASCQENALRDAVVEWGFHTWGWPHCTALAPAEIKETMRA